MRSRDVPAMKGAASDVDHNFSSNKGTGVLCARRVAQSPSVFFYCAGRGVNNEKRHSVSGHTHPGDLDTTSKEVASAFRKGDKR